MPLSEYRLILVLAPKAEILHLGLKYCMPLGQSDVTSVFLRMAPNLTYHLFPGDFFPNCLWFLV